MRTDLTKILRKGLAQPGFYKNTYLQAKRVMQEYERRLDELAWACERLKAFHPDVYVRFQALVILEELRQLKQSPRTTKKPDATE